MMQLGFVSAILPDLNFREVIDFASDNGFRCVELMCWPNGKSERRYAGVTHLNMDQLTVDNARQTNEYLSKKGIEIAALGYYPNPLDPNLNNRAIYINHIKKIINGAALLGVRTVSTFIGRDPTQNIQFNFAEFKKVWPELIKLAESKDIRIAIENCPMLFSQSEWPGGMNLATTPRIWQEMFDLIPSAHFGLNFDPSHFIWQQMDYIKPIYEFADKLFMIHVKDHKIDHDRLDQVGIMATPLEYSSPKIPGLGDVDWGKLISALTDVRYHGPAVIEVEDKSFEDTLADRLYAIQQSKRYFSQFIL